MKKSFAFVFVFLVSLSAQPKVSPIDSLYSIINNPKTNDTSVVWSYLELATLSYLRNPDTAIFYCEKAEEISEISNFERGMSESYSWLAYLVSNKGDLEGAIKYNFKALELYEKQDNQAGIGTTYNNIGSIQKKKGNLDSAQYYFQKGLDVRIVVGDLIMIANSLNNLGSAYHDQGDIPTAIDYYLYSLKLKEEIGDKNSIATSKYNIAYIYNQQGDTAKALSYFRDAKKINEEIGNQSALAQTLVNIGNIYSQHGDYETAIEYTQKSLVINKEINNQFGISNSYYNLGILYRNMGHDVKAQTYFSDALVILEAYGIKTGAASCLVSIGRIKFDNGNIEDAERDAKRGFELSLEIGAPEEIRDAAKLLSEIYEQQKRGTDALKMHKVFIAMRDSLENIEAQKSILEQQLNYDFQKKEAIAQANHEGEIAVRDAKEKKQSIISWSIGVGLFLIIVLTLIIAYRLKISNSQKRIIQKKNEENELLLGEIHHRVKNNLQVISSLLSLQEKSLTDVSAKKAILEGKERVKSMGLIHKMLYQNDNFSGIEMNDYINKLVQGLMDSFGVSSSELDVDTQFDSIKLDVDSAIPVGLIINELVINSFKYAYDKSDQPKISVQLNESEKGLMLEIADNGKGEVEAVEGSTSFGYKLVKSLVRQLNGELTLTKKDGLCYQILIKDYKLV